MKMNNRVLMPDGSWKSFPEKKLDKELKQGLIDVKPVIAEVKEELIKKPGAAKKASKKASKKVNKKNSRKQEVKKNEQRLNGN